MARDKAMAEFLNFKPLENKNWMTLYAFEAAFIIAINIPTIMTFTINRQTFGRRMICLVNLSVSDLMFGIFLLIQSVYNQTFTVNTERDMVKYNKAHAIMEAFTYFSCASSGYCLDLLAVERVYATFAPFRHRATRLKSYATAIGTGWCACIIVGTAHYLTPFDSYNILMYFYTCGIIAGLGVGIISYIAILIKVRSQNQLHNRTNSTLQLRERKMAYTLMMVTCCALLTWLPIGIVFLLNKISTIQISGDASALAVMIVASASLSSPIIYAFRMREFRKILFHLFCKCLSLHQVPPSRANSVAVPATSLNK